MDEHAPHGTCGRTRESFLMQTIRIIIEELAYHRNGVSGEGFHVVTFREGREPMVAVVFEGEGQVAVFNRERLGDGRITSRTHGYRGEVYEPFLRKAIGVYRNRYRAR
jgi:hypothetical protein